MNKDIQTLIEREACEHWSQSNYKEVAEKVHSENDMCKTSAMARKVSNSSFQAGAHFALSLFKWRKASEGLPEVKQEAYPVLVYRKYKKEEYKMDTLWIIPDMSVGDSFKFYGVAEWMPIPQID